MKPLPPELEAKIDEVHSWMFDGDLDLVKKKCRMSKVYICRVLKKKAFNQSVLEAAIEVMNDNKSRFEIPNMKRVA